MGTTFLRDAKTARRGATFPILLAAWEEGNRARNTRMSPEKRKEIATKASKAATKKRSEKAKKQKKNS